MPDNESRLILHDQELFPKAEQFVGNGKLHRMLTNQITQWRSQLLEGAAGVVGSETNVVAAALVIDVKTLHAKIGELTLANGFLEGALDKAGLLPSAKR